MKTDFDDDFNTMYPAKRARISARHNIVEVEETAMDALAMEKKDSCSDLMSTDIQTPTSISDNESHSSSFRSLRSNSLASSSSSSCHSSPFSTTSMRSSSSKDSCLSIMKAATDSTQCQLEYTKADNEKLRRENAKLRQSAKELSGELPALHALDMEQLCDLEEKLMLALYKVRREREDFYNYYCVSCEKKQSYVLYQGCDCNALCFDCIKQRQEESQLKCPDCDEWYT